LLGAVNGHEQAGGAIVQLVTEANVEELLLAQDLEARFAPEHLSALTDEFLEKGTNVNLKELAGDRKYVVGIIPATSAYADVARSVEVMKFAKVFKRSWTDVYQDYAPYDEASTFLAVIDVQGDKPMPVGAMRFIEPGHEIPLKSVHDLVVDDPANPWIDEIKTNYFDADEPYDAVTAWDRLCQRAGIDLNLAETMDVATIASLKVNGKRSELRAISLALYHSCVHYAKAQGAKNLVSIQDLAPFRLLQGYGDPFDTFEGLEPHPYGGPDDTVPAFCNIDEGIRRIRNKDAFTGHVFADGFGLTKEYLFFDEYDPARYSNEAIGYQSLAEIEAAFKALAASSS